MTANLETVGECRILRVGGRIDFESALDFEQRINSMIQEEGDCFIIELSQVELLSSAGLRVLLSTAKRISQRNASLGLAAPSDVVRQVFEISHFNLLFKIFASVSEAVTVLKGPSAACEPGEPAQEAQLSETATLEDEPKSSAPVVPDVEEPARPAVRMVESSRAEESPPVTPPQPPVVPKQSEAATVAPLVPPLPTTLSTQAPPVAVPPRPVPVTKLAGSPPATASAQPPPSPGAIQSAPVAPASEQSPVVRPPGTVPRREAKYPARLEVRAEGISYPCKDGDVIGTDGQLAASYFSQISNLAPRHLLIGKSDERWFVFTPMNVQHPFILDGIPLRAGERKFLQYVEHQAEFSGHVFGLRFIPEQRKEGFLARMFGRKKGESS
ncbi:MAG TPA: anti-sigma factor antagonist [Chthoniobacterales bacterium]